MVALVLVVTAVIEGWTNVDGEDRKAALVMIGCMVVESAKEGDDSLPPP